jgi:hypothetical protein
MQVHYKVIQAKDFIKARPTGDTDVEQSKRVLGEIAEMASMPGEYEILLDVREAFGNLDQNDIWELVDELGRHRKAFRNKIAVLARDDEQFNKAVFGEMAATTSGFQLRAFTDYEDAINWLQSSDGLESLWQ